MHGRLLTLALAACLLLLPAGAASGHGKAGHGKLTKSQQRAFKAFEQLALGTSHAAEHARWRSALRNRVVPPASRARARASLTGPKDQVGSWDPPHRIPIFGIHTIVLPTSKVLFFAYPQHVEAFPGHDEDQELAFARLWDPAKGTGDDAFKVVDPPGNVNLWCAGQSLLANGTVLVTGGNFKYPESPGNPGGAFAGLKEVWTFNPFNEKWTRHPDMRKGRWYPTQTLLPDGRTLIMGGLDEGGYAEKNDDLEIFTPHPTDLDGVGTITRLGPDGVLDNGDAGEPDGPPVGDLYPHMFSMPSGRVIVAGPWTSDSWIFKTTTNPWTPTQGPSWAELPNTRRSRTWGTAVQLPNDPTRVMQIGGSDRPAPNTTGWDWEAVPSTSSFDEDDFTPTPTGGTVPDDKGWYNAAFKVNGSTVHNPDPNATGPNTGPFKVAVNEGTLNVPRAHHNTVLLPDSTMVTVGGGKGDGDTTEAGDNPTGQFKTGQWAATTAHKQVELWTPSPPGATNPNGTWRLGAAQQEYRTYHSTAVLLPDGRVWSAGDDFNGTDGADSVVLDKAEIYSPPYLFDGNAPAPRPSITDAPATLDYGQSFIVRSSGPAPSRATLLAPGAVTHSTDMSQRHLALSITTNCDGTQTLSAPANANLAPPGYYMLHLVDATGTPSVARWVRLADFAGPQPGPASPCPAPVVTPGPSETATPTPAPTVAVTPTVTPTPTVVPVRKPSVRATIIRRSGRRYVQLKVGRATARTVRVQVTLKRGTRVLGRVTVSARTGRTTILRLVRVPSKARTVRARVR